MISITLLIITNLFFMILFFAACYRLYKDSETYEKEIDTLIQQIENIKRFSQN
jgi:hypothetical protein